MLPKNLKFIFSVMQLLVLMVWVSHALAAQVQLAWDAPTNPDGTPVTTLAGYRLYYWLSYWQDSLEVTQSVDVGNQSTYTLTGLAAGETYSFVVTAYDTSGNESGSSNTVTVPVISSNHPPVALADVVSTPAGTPVTIAVLANDSDPDGNPLTIAAVTQGAYGTVTISGPTVTYTPAATFAGIDSFTYTITDDQGGSVTATITVTVFVMVQLEAEAGTLYSPMAVSTDTTTPTLQYVRVPDSNGNIWDPLQNGGYVQYSFAVPKADGYVIWGRVSPSETGTGSFFIGVDEPAGNGLITDVSPTAYQVATIHVGHTYYIDSASTITSMPTEFDGLGAIKTANADKNNRDAAFLTFTLLQNATLYVAYAANVSSFPPSWLTASFTNTGQIIQTTNGPMAVWKKDVPAGPMTLPGNKYQTPANASSQYFVLLAFQGPAPYLVWDVPPMPTSSPPPPPWAWDQAASDTTPVFFLAAGNHTLTIRQRESGSKLDTLVITNNVNLIPHD